MNEPSVILIKLGGSVITDKTTPETLRPDVLRRLVSEVKAALETSRDRIIIAHGAGSFAHVPAKKYDTMNGFKDESSKLGMAIVQDSAARLNRLVIQACLEQGLPAVSVCMSSSIVTKNKQLHSYYSDVFQEHLRHDLLPISYGDVIIDQDIGCTIWSTDVILPFFAQQFLQHGWTVKKVIHVTDVPGVYKNIEKPEVGIFEVITPQNKNEVQKSMGSVVGYDVTGGMWSKITESLTLTKHGVETEILSGKEPGRLQAALLGEKVISTRITV